MHERCKAWSVPKVVARSLAAALLTAVGACETTGDRATPPTLDTQKAAIVPQAKVEPPEKPVGTRPRPAPAPARAVGPIKLIGLDEGELQELLGDPSQVREKPPARIWTYRAETCSLELFLYPDLSTTRFHALSYEVVAPPSETDVAAFCVGRIEQQNRDRKKRTS